METVFFCTDFFLGNWNWWNPILKERPWFWLMQLIFWIVEIIFPHFLRQQATAASGSSLFFNWNIFSANPSFQPEERKILTTGNSNTLFQFFSASEYYYWDWGKFSLLKRTIFLLVDTNNFDFFKYFLEWKQLFCIMETYFNKSFYPASLNSFSI